MNAKLDPLNGKIRESQHLIENVSQQTMDKLMPFIYPMLYFPWTKLYFTDDKIIFRKKHLNIIIFLL